MANESILSSALSGFIPVPIAAEIVADVTRGSSVMRLARMTDMQGKPEKTVPVLVSGPGAYWVGESERIQTSKAQWIFPKLTSKKMGVIVPMSKEALSFPTVNAFEQIKPHIAEAFAVAFDAAALWGTGTPFGVGASIFEKLSAIPVGNVFQRASVAGQDLAGDVSDVMALIEADGYDVNGFAAPVSVKNSLRKLRNTAGDPIFADIQGDTPAQIHGQSLAYVRNGAWDATKAQLLAGSWNYALFGVVAGIEYEILREATLQTVTMADGKPLSLAEQDMIALKATMQIAWLVVKDSAFAALTPPAAG